MSRKCVITGKRPQVGNNVSHANNKTKRRFLVNIRKTSMLSESLGHMIRLRLSANGIRTIEKCGGLDAFLLKADGKKLDKKILALKKIVEQRTQVKSSN